MINKLYDVLRRPLLTEKSTAMKDGDRKVALEVATWADKSQVKRAAEKFFGVEVLSVNTMVCRGKVKRVGKFVGKKNNWKKAIVTLAAGSDVDAFGSAPQVPQQAE